MRCEQARQLFDAYLDGELSLSLRNELGAHRVQCPDCRRRLALMEVAGHILSSDREPTVGENFAERLLACVEAPRERRTFRFRRSLYLTGPLALAAVIALAFVGIFNRRESLVLGKKVTRPPAVNRPDAPPLSSPVQNPQPGLGSDATDRLVPDQPKDDWFARLRANMGTFEQLNSQTLSWLESLQPPPDGANVEEEVDIVGPPAPDPQDDAEADAEDF